MPSEVMTMDDLKVIEEKKKQGGGIRGKKEEVKKEEVKIHTADETKAILDKKITKETIKDFLQLFKDPTQSATTRRGIIDQFWKTGRYDVRVKDSEEVVVKKLKQYIEDFTPFEKFINSGNKNMLYPPKSAKIPINDKLTFKQILDTINGKPSKMLTQIKEIDFNDPATINKVAKQISEITPSKKPTEPPVLSPTEKLDDEITSIEESIKNLEGKIELSTDEEQKSEMRGDLDELKKNLLTLQKEKEIDSKPTATATTPVPEPTPEPVQPPPVINPFDEQPPPVINPFDEQPPPKAPRVRMSTPPTSPRTAPPPAAPPPAAPAAAAPPAAATTTPKQDQEKGRPQDPTAIDTMQPLPSKSDLIPEARLGTKGKDINDLIDDIKYFMDNFEGQLKREKGFFKNVDIRNIKELRELHDRIVGKLAPEKQKSTDGNKVGIIVNADDYIREQMKKILQEQTFSSLRPADVVIDVGSRAVEGRDTKDFGDFEVKRTIDGGLSSQREAVYRYMPSENDRGEEVEEPLTRKKKSNRIKMPKPGLNNKRTTAIRMNTRNPFRGNPNTIKLKYLY